MNTKYTYMSTRQTFAGFLAKVITYSILCFLIIGCSSREALKPVDFEKRIIIKILPFEDLTNVYNKASEQFENRSSVLLDSNFIQIIRGSERIGYTLYTYPNPFRSFHANDSTSFSLSVQGEVERCSYEKAVEINSRIADYHLLGLWGLVNYRDADLCGFSQFRVKFFDSHKNIIDSSVIVGTSCGSIQMHSRRELIDRAITQASYNFIVYLFDNLFANQIQLPCIRESISKSRASQIKYIYSDN